MAKRTIKLNIKLPKGVTATKELEAVAAKAANDAVSDALTDFLETQKWAEKLAREGIDISAEELMRRKKGKSPRKALSSKQSARKRVVLTAGKRKALAADLNAGMKIKEATQKYGVSSSTVMNVKREADLVQKRK